ncbi:MAG: AAA family ATPase [Oscillospiraceae bacterium]|nr:AAA family ATPase [Oscillospiraceae bacterium]
MSAGLEFPLKENPAAKDMSRLFAQGRRYPPTLLIEGAEGSGKSELARYLGAALLCRGEENRPCGQCSACRKLQKNIHPDFQVFESEKKAARSFHVGLVRALRASAYIRPNESRVAVFLLEDCETMTDEAQNALLKILEEPPGAAVFLLTCKNRSMLLETVRSRVASLSLEIPGAAACLEVLRERFPEAEPEKLKEAAQCSGGSIGAAVRILDGREKGGEGIRAAAAGLLVKIAEADDYGALLLMRPWEKDRQGLAALLEQLYSLVCGFSLEGGYSGGGAGLSRRRLFRLAAIIEDARDALAFNAGGLILTAGLCARCIEAVESA